MNKKFLRLISFVPILILLVTMLSVFLSRGIRSNDFWWHIATGRYIVTEGELPDKDPFSFTSEMAGVPNPFPEREKFVLKSNWLAQVSFYFIYDWLGISGIVWMRSLGSLLIIILIWIWLVSHEVSSFIVAVFIYFLSSFLIYAAAERPLLFTNLFFTATIILLEDFRERRGKKIFLLPLIMIVWANMHGAFILGFAVTVVYLFGETINVAWKRTVFSRPDLKRFYGAGILTLVVSLLNPTGWDSIPITFSSKYNVIWTGVQEWQSPFLFYSRHFRDVEFNYVTLVLLFPLVLIVRKVRLNIVHILLFTGLFYKALTSDRMVVYLAIASSFILAREIDGIMKTIMLKHLSEGFRVRTENAIRAAALCFVLLVAVTHADKLKYLTAPNEAFAEPVSAVDFIERHAIQGRMFNEFSSGGYIAWRLYPRYRTFIDSRMLNYNIDKAYRNIYYAGEEAKPDYSPVLWSDLLGYYDINFIVISTLDNMGHVSPLMLKLSESREWIPVHADSLSMIFVRKSPLNQDLIEKQTIPKEILYNVLITRIETFLSVHENNPWAYVSLAEVLTQAGRPEGALKAYRQALQFMPDNEGLQKKIMKMEAAFYGTPH